jgi:hypothetical protein
MLLSDTYCMIDGFQGAAMLTSDITFCCRKMEICRCVHVSFDLECYRCQITFHYSFYITPFQFEFPSEVTKHYLRFVPRVQQQFMAFISKSLNKSGEKTVCVEFVSHTSSP